MAGEGFLVGPCFAFRKNATSQNSKTIKMPSNFPSFQRSNGFYWIFGALDPFFMTQAQVADWGEHPDDVECADHVDDDG